MLTAKINLTHVALETLLALRLRGGEATYDEIAALRNYKCITKCYGLKLLINEGLVLSGHRPRPGLGNGMRLTGRRQRVYKLTPEAAEIAEQIERMRDLIDKPRPIPIVETPARQAERDPTPTRAAIATRRRISAREQQRAARDHKTQGEREQLGRLMGGWR